MVMFRYKAVDAKGTTVTDVMQAETPDEVSERLSARALTPISVVTDKRKQPKTRSDSISGHVRPEELVLLTTQLSTMLRAGIPILRVFEILENESENKTLGGICGRIAGEVRAGSSLFAALNRFPKVFPPLYVNMVRAGERSGTLPQVLARLIYVLQHENKVRTEIRSVLQYPIMVVVVLFGSMGILLTTVVPRFARIYASAGILLPLPTRICITLSNVLRDQGALVLAGIVFLIVAGVLSRRTARGKYLQDRFLLAIPYVGTVVIKAALSRFASVFSILQASGVGMLESIDILTGTLANSAMVHHFRAVQGKVEHGQGLSRPLAGHPFFTPMFVSMVAVGEETGKLDEMLREIANHYDAEVEYATKKLTGAIGPFLIVILAAVVGFFALAVYLPMWDIAQIATRTG